MKMYNRKKLDDQDNSKIENIAKLVPNGKKSGFGTMRVLFSILWESIRSDSWQKTRKLYIA